LALSFVIASRHSAARALHRGTLVLIEGCAIQIAGLAALALTVVSLAAPTQPCWRWCWRSLVTARGW
jgi:hypothetical protein